MSLAEWMDRNLATQGYCLTGEQTRGLRIGLRFSTALCLVLVAAALALQSAALLFGLAAIALVAGFGPRHPFDLLWNHAVRRAFSAPELPPNPPRRRHAFKLATAWLVVVATLFATGATTIALVLGAAMLVSCTAVTVANFCVPSQLMAAWERLATRHPEVAS